MINYLDKLYNSEINALLKMLIFNLKDYHSEIYQNTKELNIVHLFTVSGLHISILITIIDKIFKKYKLFNFLFSFSILIFIIYLVNFSVSSIRVLVTLIIKKISKEKLTGFNSSCLGGILIAIIWPYESARFGYILSFLCILTIHFINSLTINKIAKSILINIFLPLVTFNIIVLFNQAFSFNSIIYSYIFSMPIIFLYISSLLLCWIPFLVPFFDFVSMILIKIISWATDSNQLSNFNFNNLINVLFYSLWMIVINIKLMSELKNEINYKLN